MNSLTADLFYCFLIFWRSALQNGEGEWVSTSQAFSGSFQCRISDRVQEHPNFSPFYRAIDNKPDNIGIGFRGHINFFVCKVWQISLIFQHGSEHPGFFPIILSI